jgi:hypothetical protein
MKRRNGYFERATVSASLLLLFSSLFPLGAAAQGTKQDLNRVRSRLAEEVRHRLVLLPYYGVFDNLAGMMANGVPGVFKVTNELRVEKQVS